MRGSRSFKIYCPFISLSPQPTLLAPDAICIRCSFFVSKKEFAAIIAIYTIEWK